jgi:DNA-binding GntR family transcriptional regulator
MPKSQQIESIAHRLREDILQGAFKPYNVLPTRRALADKFETTPDTIAKVLRNLEVEGLVVRGKGHSVRVNTPRERITTNDETFRDYMKAQGYTVKVEHLATLGVIPATPQLAALFRESTGLQLVERARREVVDGIVYRYSRKYYRAEFVSGDVLQKIQQDHTFNVRPIFEEQKPLARIQERLIARTIIDAAEAELLQAAKGVPVLEQWKINYAHDKSVVFVSLVVFNAAYFVKTYDYALGDEPKLSEFSQDDKSLQKTTSE